MKATDGGNDIENNKLKVEMKYFLVSNQVITPSSRYLLQCKL